MESFATQLRTYIIRPTLGNMGMFSQAAENLLVGTAAHESNGFVALKQYHNGPALSFYQIEPATHDDLWQNSVPGIRRRMPQAIETLESLVAKQYASQPPASYLIKSLSYATAVARLLYWRAPFTMPEADDIEQLAVIYKQYYNTHLGKATIKDFTEAYEKHCKK
tara:strand:+ start:1215 stop:1709 length:495 start_codon:yes stop_codon:yes gene_type:complete